MSRKLKEPLIEQARSLVLQQGLGGVALAEALGVDERTAREYAKRVREEAEGASSNGHGHEPTLDANPAGEISGPRTGVWTPDQPALAPHPHADLFPALAAMDLEALTADIAAQGLREPIWLYEGKILDGRNRYRVCQALGIACPTREYTGGDPLGFVVSMNLQRRHLTEGQRAMVAAKLANMRQGERTDLQPSENSPKVSQAKAAELLNISDFSLKAAKKVQLEAQPELVKAVETGTIAVSAAARLANEPVAVQRAVVKKLETGAAKTVTAALKEVQEAANGHPPTKVEGHWADPLAKAYSELRLALDGFDSFGGMAAVVGTWTQERQRAFSQRMDWFEAQVQRLLREFRAVREMVRLTEAEDTPEGRADG